MATQQNVYLVVSKDMTIRRLVRAPNRTRALRHVAADTLGVAIATQDNLIELIAAGAKVEDAVAADDSAEG